MSDIGVNTPTGHGVGCLGQSQLDDHGALLNFR